ncbi:hypothetical protein PVL29_000755 [Vitis rotundifolia]|uniref:protein-disulfide reductase n=1 Tax=Vitis rotundifolia TaxID=103349 RepID=A0AA39E7W0_VITRO|nr:hypothetical protein PVL29_000755 [Vitis rotundifolia]
MASENVDNVAHDLVSLLTREDRDFLVCNNGHQSSKGKKVWLYFSASWCGPCLPFTPKLVEAYNELSSNDDFEIIFVSADSDDESFNGYFSKMPWLAIPFSDSDPRDQLNELFKVMGIPNLMMLDESGKVLREDAVEIIQECGVEAYPFTTPEKITEMKEKEETVHVSELEGKFFGLYFSLSSYNACLEFTPTLVDIYEKLRVKGVSSEIVMISLDDEEESFKTNFGSKPWLALPFNKKSCEKLARYFELSALPTLVVIGPDGKTLHSNVAEAIEEHGIQAYPFTPEKFSKPEEIEKAKREAQTLESILVSGDRDFVIGKDGVKLRSALRRCISVSDLVGKNILLYFSAHWCPPCQAFLPKLIEAYQKIKTKDEAFHVIFISSMPWLALPFGDKRKASLSRTFKVYGIPSLIAIGPTGRTVSTEATDLVMIHGASAYPFAEEHIKKMEKVKHALHEQHELVLTERPTYMCDGCEEHGHLWSFYCAECVFDLHPKRALEEDKRCKEDEMEKASPGDGWKCDGKCVPELESS